MRSAILSAMFCAAFASVVEAGTPRAVVTKPQPKRTNLPANATAATKSVAMKAQEDGYGATRRCAFLGRCGSFTLIGPTGTAAYRLGNGQYIADLESAGQDANWWFYRPVGNGDPSTTMWAFARRPRRGCYSVLRFANGGWRRYEQTQAWGIGLGDSGPSAGAAPSAGSVDDLILAELRAIRDKLKDIQQAKKPSLNDLETLIKKLNEQSTK